MLAVLMLFSGSAAAQETGRPGQPVRVLAASSLTGPVSEVAARWEARTGAEVELSFGGSSRLATKLLQGARADVYLSADPRWVDRLDGEGLVASGTRRTFATNRLVWVVPWSIEEAPSGLEAVSASPPEHLAVGGPNVPAGAYARQALREAGLWERLAGRVVSAENVKRALQWVALGEADASIVYRSDARGSKEVQVAFAFPGRLQPSIRYEGAVLEGTNWREQASDFLAFLEESAGRSVLREAGFGPPPGDGPSREASSGGSAADPVDEWSAVRLSLLIGLLCVVAGLLPAVAFGWLLARYRFVGKSLVATLLLAPLALPPVVTGFVLLRLLGESGAVGAVLAWVGIQVSFTTLGAAVAAFAVSFPLYLLAARSAFELVDPRYEEVSRTLGVPPRQTFWRVTIPLAAPGLGAGALLAFARAIGEFGATTVLAGNVPGETQTIPLAIYTLLESPGGYGDIWVLVGVSMGLSLLAVFGFEWLDRRRQDHLDARGP